MSKLSSFYKKILGDIDEIDSEKYYMIIACFFSPFYMLLLCSVHILLGLPAMPAFVVCIGAFFTFLLYLMIRFWNKVFIAKLILTFGSLVAIDFTWYYKYLSDGPVLFFLFLIGAMIHWVWSGKALVFLFSIYLLNVALLAGIEYISPSFLMEYPDAHLRTIDIYLSFLLYSVFMIALLIVVKKDFIKRRDSAVRANKLKSAFLANMSHEIRTPMNAIIGFSNFLGGDISAETRKKYISIIQNSSNSLLQLINDIIDLSKIETGDLAIVESDFNIKPLFEDLKHYYNLELVKKEKNNIVLDYLLPDDDILLRTDHLRLKQILSNLLNNAVKFTCSGRIIFSCVKKNGENVFWVSDTGTGIPSEDQTKIFERFTKFDYKGLNTEGTGIGLSIVEKIIELLNGRIWLNSKVNEGSVFYFAIPDKIPVQPEIKQKKTYIMDINPVRKSKKLILVVEDDKTSYLLIKEMLKPLKIELYHVTDGLDAINFIRIHPDVNMILMDLKLPFTDGYEATRAIKSINPKIPVIAQTAYAMLGDRNKALDAGCDDYITKPIDCAKLLATVNRYINVGEDENEA